jgi:rod shape-determining protein MreC
MQRILNALVQFRNPILYLVLLGFSLLFLNSRSSFHQSQLEKYGLYVSQSLYGVSHRIGSYFQLKKINEKLLQENQTLKELELKSKGIPLYQNALKVNRRFPFQVKAAHVIKNSFLNQQNFLIIDKGSENGIKEEMAVITDRGIIGIVKSVSDHYASVISILNQDLKINVRLKNSAAFGTLSWKGKNPIDFQVEDIVMNAVLEKGDTLITGGMSSYFPMGIPLGKISEFERDVQSGYYTISTELFEDPSQVYYVYVIENLDRQELFELKKELPQ